MNYCKDLPGQLERVLKDALLIFGAPDNGLLAEDLSVYAFPQMWGSTALGLGGIGGQAMTTAQTCAPNPRGNNMTDKETIADLRAKLAAKTKCIEDMKREMGSDKTVVELFVDAEFRAEKAEAELVEARKKKRELELAFCNCEELERFGKHAPWCVVNKVLSGKPKGGE